MTSQARDTQTKTLAQIFAMPLVLAAISLVGLVAALVGDGWYDAVSWVALGAVLATIAWALAKPRRG